MVNPDILGGLKSALTRGYSLEEAMLSLLNGGYKEEEITEAAHSLQAQVPELPASELLPKPIYTPKEKQPQQSKFRPAQPKQVVTQGVAAYTTYDNSKMKVITIILVILLLALLGILGVMYFFREPIMDFINTLF